jgi:hypothetical protein
MTGRIFDTFMVNDEFDILECRLYELQDIPNLIHIAVEADVDHQDHPKPYHLSDNLDRFAPWKERLVVVRASGLPTHADDPDPWARELAQREHCWTGLKECDAEPDDVVLHGDVDEIPNALGVRNVKPNGYLAFLQRLYCFAVDWQHPELWCGTVAGRVGGLKDFRTFRTMDRLVPADSFGYMRSCRNIAATIPGALAGWHLSWLGGRDAALRKLGSFCHPEIEGRTRTGLESDEFLQTGYHVDGKRMIPVDVDETWPRWIRERKCPASWFRPR